MSSLKINQKHKRKATLANIPVGEVFSTDKDSHLYMKVRTEDHNTPRINCINFHSYEIITFPRDKYVYPVEKAVLEVRR